MIMFLAGVLGAVVGYALAGYVGLACATTGVIVGVVASYFDLPPDIRRALNHRHAAPRA